MLIVTASAVKVLLAQCNAHCSEELIQRAMEVLAGVAATQKGADLIKEAGGLDIILKAMQSNSSADALLSAGGGILSTLCSKMDLTSAIEALRDAQSLQGHEIAHAASMIVCGGIL